MTKGKKILTCVVVALAVCFIAIGYAAVQDELIVNGIVSVDGYIIKDDLSAADIEGYSYDADTKTIEIKDIYYNSDDGKNYKVTGIAENGFSSAKIAAIKEINSDFALDATTIEAFTLSEGVSQIGENAFNGLSNLKFFDTTKYGNTYFEFEDKTLFKLENDNKCTLVYYSFDKTETYYVVDESTIIAITDGAFSNNKYCTAILTSYYDDNAWGSPAAVMINTSAFLDTITNVTGDVDNGYKVYLQNATVNTPIVLQGNDADPDNSFYGQPIDVTVQEGGFITIDATLAQPCQHGHYSQIYLSSWQKLTYAYLTEKNTLEIHNCLTAIVGGKIYQWVNDNEEEHRVLLNSTLYTLPSGTVSGSDTLPAEQFSSWATIASQVQEVKVVDDIAPTSVSYWFRNMEACAKMDIAKLNTENITNMSYMFAYCTSLTELDVSGFNTSAVKNMNDMFFEVQCIKTLDLSSFDTAQVESMYQMFNNCYALTDVDISSFNTAKVKTMAYMFSGDGKLTSLDLSSFDTKNVKAMERMFYNCSALEEIIVSDKFVAEVNTSTNMFGGCSSLKGGNGTTLATVQATGVSAANSYKATYARIDGVDGQLGYFTVVSHDHKVDIWQVNDDSTHIGYCTVYGEPVKQEHTFVDGKCSVCDQCEHSVSEWTDNEDGTHSGTCDVCQATVSKEHEYNESGSCVCGATPPTTEDGEE